jgi:hypothetical protein
VTIGGNLPNQFNDNDDNGLRVFSGGAVSLSYFNADHNTESGIYIENDYPGRSGNVTINLTYTPAIGSWLNSVTENDQYGLRIESFGNILIDRCDAHDNNYDGADLYNVDAPSAKTVTGKNSSFSYNGMNGLDITSKGNITLVDVQGYHNYGSYGARISNSTGMGNVSVTCSGPAYCNFTANTLMGLRIYAAGTITLKNVDASGNPSGAVLWNLNGVGKSVTVTNGVFSDSTSSYGLQITTTGPVILANVTSDENTGSGTIIDSTYASKAQIVKITNSSFNSNQGGDGLDIYSLGSVTLNGIQASGNASSGAHIDTCVYDGAILACRGSGSVTVVGKENLFNDNSDAGLYMVTRFGATLNNISASNNDTGLMIWHNYTNCSGNILINASSGFTNTISGNNAYGIYIEAYGNITLQRFDASNNALYGVYLSNQSGPAGKKITLSYGTVNDNQYDGMRIYATGPVSLTAIQALRSSKYFYSIDDDTGQYVYDRLPHEQVNDEVWYFDGSNGQNISVDLISTTFDAYLELYDENWYLIRADDDGAGGTDARITTTLGADGTYYLVVKSATEGGYGNYNLRLDGSSPTTRIYNYRGVYIDNRYQSGTGSITVIAPSGSYGLDIRDNSNDGLTIYTNGTVNINGLNSSYNGGSYGMYLEDYSEGASVTIKNSTFDHNDDMGLYLYAKGTVTWSTGSAIGNLTNFGANIRNDAASTYRPVNLSNVVFSENNGYGLYITSLGSVTLKNVNSTGNLGGYGAKIDNCLSNLGVCAGYGNITISGTYGLNNFDDNTSIGLQISSRGTVSLTNVNASGNADGGVYIFNSYDNAYGNVTVKSSSKKTNLVMSDNHTGCTIYSSGIVTLMNATAEGNTNSGFEVDNSSALTPKKATLMYLLAANNGNNGVWVGSVGLITVANVEGYSNSTGVSLTNWEVTTPQSISISRVKVDGNSGSGLIVNSKGDVTLNNIIATANNYGAYITNTWGTDSKVTVLGSMGENIFSGNSEEGLTINSNGIVSLTSVTAMNNLGSGILSNTAASLTASKLMLYNNGRYGFTGIVDQDVSLSGVQSYNNGSANNGDGLYLTLQSSSIVKILQSVFAGNYGSGIDILSGLPPILTGTFYFGNDADNTGDKNLFLH